MGELEPDSWYIVKPELRLPAYLPMVKFLHYKAGNIMMVELSTGVLRPLHIDWLLCKATPLMKALS
jgi:hypothetical protein